MSDFGPLVVIVGMSGLCALPSWKGLLSFLDVCVANEEGRGGGGVVDGIVGGGGGCGGCGQLTKQIMFVIQMARWSIDACFVL